MTLEASTVAILDAAKTPVGTGILIDKGRVLTCAHVVNAALGREKTETALPQSEQIWIRIHGAREEIAAWPDLNSWSAPPAQRQDGADVCILSVKPPSDVTSARLAVFSDLAGRGFRAAGYPEGWDVDFATGTIAGLDTHGLWLLRPNMLPSISRKLIGSVARPAGQIAEGFSGGPVEVRGRLAGMIMEVRAELAEATAYMLPVSGFPEAIRKAAEVYTNVVEMTYAHVRNAHEWLGHLFATTKHAPRVAFDIRARLSGSYEEVLRAYRADPNSPVHADSYEANDLTPEDFARLLAAGNDDSGGRLTTVVLMAPGGAGKSSFLSRLMGAASDQNLVPFYLDFSRGDPKMIPESGGAEALLVSWFAVHGGRGAARQLLDLSLQPNERGMKALLVIDGFNQSRRDWDGALDRIASLANQELAGAAIVIADRLVDRAGHSAFRRALVPPLPRGSYAPTLTNLGFTNQLADDPNWQPLLSSPLILSILLQSLSDEASSTHMSIGVPTRFSVLCEYYQKKCLFSPESLLVLAETALRVYSTVGCTTIPREAFEAILKQSWVDTVTVLQTADASIDVDLVDLQDKLRSHGVINEIGGEEIEFRHQVLHDWLAALRVACCREDEEELLLRADGFDALSLGAASSDAVELAVEALLVAQPLTQQLSMRREVVSVPQFLTELYDWNAWITLQCVLSFEKRSLANPPVPSWMRHALYALNLEKMFDVFLHTSMRAERLRREIPDSAHIKYRDSRTSADLLTRVDETFVDLIANPLETDDANVRNCGRWHELFTCTELDREAIDCIWSDPLFGWTSANVMQRLGVSNDLAELLMRVYSISKSTSDSSRRAASFRWRLVHALGRAPAGQVLTFLYKVALEDRREHPHIRYGALRSALQVAALSGNAEHITRVLAYIERLLGTFFLYSESPRMRAQLRRSYALNESCAQLSPGALKVWLASATGPYRRILRLGAENARKQSHLQAEVPLWEGWENALAEVERMGIDDSTGRRQKLLQAIERDQR